MSNRLKNETSPYLLQHAENPVNWYPWCAEAFDKAKKENKPIFLSIGYSTCHWCHVMAHESFEDKATADILNEHFISVKVDREERPDIDSVYMSVCQAFTGSGGWPTSIFMTWDKKPFFAGTYFPPDSRYGIPSFSELLNAIVDEWKQNRDKLLQSADGVINHLKNNATDKAKPVKDLTEKAVNMFKNSFDSVYGGFGSALKFPTPHNLMFLMLYSKQTGDSGTLRMAEKTLMQMRKGGIFDHIGYGFSRYSTDKYFLAPHFEKMLYDNALLIMAYAAAHSLTGEEIYLDTAEKTAEYILREMTSEDGGFYSAQDADSEGVEGKYYTFSFDEIISVLGKERGDEFAKAFDITPDGNFERVNIPNLLKRDDVSTGFDDEIRKLYNYRKSRLKLHLDDKILLSWNSLMIAAFAMLYRTLRNDKYLESAKQAASFVENNLCEGMKLYNSFRDGKHSGRAFLDDYAFYITAHLELYNSTLDESYLKRAEEFCAEAVGRFADSENGGFYLCEKDSAELFMNPKETYDGAIPSGNSVMLYNLVRLYQLTEKEEYTKLAERQMDFMSGEAQKYPMGYSMFLLAKLMHENPPKHVAIVVKDCSDVDDVREKLPFLANVQIVPENEKHPLVDDKTTYYVCENNTCYPPTNTL